MVRVLKVIGGGILVATGIVLSALLFEPGGPVEINSSRDFCVSFNYDKLEVSDVDGEIYLSPVTKEKPDWDDYKREYLSEIKKLIADHNEKHEGGKHEGRKYHFGTGAPARMSLVPFRGLAAGSICNYGDFKTCRNRNFWYFKKIPSKQLAQIVFENTVKKDIPFRKCVLKPAS